MEWCCRVGSGSPTPRPRRACRRDLGCQLRRDRPRPQRHAAARARRARRDSRSSPVPLVFFDTRRPDVPWRVLATIRLFMSAGQFGLLFPTCTSALPAGLAAVVLQCQMIFTLVIAAFVRFGAADPAAGARRARGRGRARDRGGRPAEGGGGGGQRGGQGRFRCRDHAVVPLLVCVGAGLQLGPAASSPDRPEHPNGFGIVVWSALVVPLPVRTPASSSTDPWRSAAFTSIGWPDDRERGHHP